MPASYVNTGNLMADPMFAPGGFTLTSGSPCHDAGLDVGQPFAGAAPDIGYAELP